MIGLLGDIRFKVSERSVLTFRNLKREISATWNTMDRIGQKPLMEFGGPDLQTASLEITLDVALGVSPSELLETLEYMTESGLILGKMLVGENPWVITKCSAAYDVILRGGEILKATVTLSLKEYV